MNKKLKNQLIIIAILVAISATFPQFWQVSITGAIGFFIAYLLTKMKAENNQEQSSKTKGKR